ncbi:STAS domain-containing protein [Streptomyces griseorubiginosus]|uniref:STAS domain-containing protein n=1 Tax=Streptomyces griseorubiginosus TaxID=67304 RepID=UPI0036EF7AD5
MEAAREIDLATAGFLAEHLDAATATAGPDVVVDLRHVEFSSGLRVVADGPRLHRLLRASGLWARFPPLPVIPRRG